MLKRCQHHPGLSGHNPLEPARLDNAVLTGVHIASFADTYMGMFTFNAARRVLQPELVGPTVRDLFSDKDKLAELQFNARKFSNSRDAVLDYVWGRLEPLIPDASSEAA